MEAAKENEVVFTDFALQEAFNGASVARLRRTFGPVQRFSRQIVCLKRTGEIARLMPAREGVRSRFIDELESNRLRTYLHDVFTNAHGVAERVALASTQAAARFERLMPAVSMVREDMLKQLAGVQRKELQQLRNSGQMSANIANAVVQGVSHNTDLYFRKIGFEHMPGPNEVVYSFQLRFILANYVLGLLWGLAGGLQQADAKKVRNDVTDTTYAAYASFYDELVTNDKKLAAVHLHTRNLLRTLFGATI